MVEKVMAVNRQLLTLFLAQKIIELEKCKLDGRSVSFGIPYKFYFGTKTENLDFIAAKPCFGFPRRGFGTEIRVMPAAVRGTTRRLKLTFSGSA